MKHRRNMIVMITSKLFLTVFTCTLILDISTNHSHANTTEDIVTMYAVEEDRSFHRLAVDKYGRWIYIAESGYLHQLSSDLKLQVEYTRQKLHDSSNCATDNCLRRLYGTYYSSETDDKILVMDYQNQQLISCNTFYRYKCNAHDFSNISKIFATEHVQIIQRGHDDPSVAFTAPCLLHNSSAPLPALYLGYVDYHTYRHDQDWFSTRTPQIEIRNLEQTQFLSVLRTNYIFYSKNHSITIERPRFIMGFSFQNSSYFLTTGVISIPSIKTNTTASLFLGAGCLSKVNHNQEKDSYNGVFITCNPGKEHSDVQLKTIQHAYIYEYINQSNPESETDSLEDEKTFMFVLFELDVKNRYAGFAVCKYDMNNIHFTSQKTQILNKDYILFHEGSPYVTAMVITAVNNHIVLFLGTQTGNLMKVSIEGIHSPNAGTANYYSDITLDEGSPINSDLLLDSTKNFLFVMTKNKLAKVKTYNCDGYRTLYECLRPQDPHCGWCFSKNTCCLKSECTDEQNIISWMSYYIYKQMNTTLISKNKFLLSAEWNETASFIKSHPFDNLTMICKKYKTCSACATSHYPCKWHLHNDRCMDETIWSSNDIVTGAISDYIPSKIRNEEVYYTTVIRDAFFCPQFSLATNNEPVIFINADTAESETATSIILAYRIPTDSINQTFKCMLLVNGNTTIQYETSFTSKHISRNLDYSEGEIECKNVIHRYADQRAYAMVQLSIVWVWNGSKHLDNPKNLQVILYKCPYVGNQCKTCVSLQYCKWDSQTKQCEYDSINHEVRDKNAKMKLCQDPTISFFTPQLGPWEGGTRIPIYTKNLGRVFPLSGNITVGDIACNVHSQSTNIAKEPLLCIMDPCHSTFHNCSGPIRLIAEDLLLTSKTTFQFVDPKINDISPTSGSTSGGTELTINGEHLNAGNIIEVYIGDLECVVFDNNSKQLKCLTGPSKLPIKTHIMMKFDGHNRTSENIYEYDENLGPDENIHKVPRGVPNGGQNTSIIFDISIQKNIVKQQEILFYIHDEEQVKTYYNKCEISNVSLVCSIPNMNDHNWYFLDEKKPKRMDYGFKIVPLKGITMNDFDVPKKYPKFLLYPDSVGDLLQGKITKQQTTSIIAKWLLENIYLFILGLVMLTVFMITISVMYWRKSAARSRKMQQQINVMGMERIALSQLVKRVVIENQLELDENLSRMLKLPNVSIVYESYPTLDANEMSPRTEYEAPRAEYELPLDEKWEIPRENIVLGEFLGEGEFGRVVKGNVSGLLQQHIVTTAAVKMLKTTHKDTDMVNLVTEMELLKLIGRHDNVLSLLGCCTQNGPLLVIIEYSPHGNLLDFLRNHHQPSEASENDLSEKVQLTFALQIARGMEYMVSLRLIHRDLAARNILIFDDYVLKIADFGLAKDIRNSDYYKQKTKGRFPVKWMAPETITHRRHSPQSDVWSYGILLWEIVTFGEVPYATYDDAKQLLKEIRSGYRMKKPEDCSMDTYCLMVKCWNHLPENRPDFTRIIHNLQTILKKMDAVIEESDSDCSSISSVPSHKANETNSLLSDTS